MTPRSQENNTSTMKTIQIPFMLTLTLLVSLMMGCATQSQKTENSPQPQLSLRPEKPMLLSGVTQASIDKEQALLAENDLDEDEKALMDDALDEDEEALFEDDLDDWEDEDLELATVADPLEWFNRAMFQFNDKLFLYLLKPAAKGYRAVTPTPVRTGVSNFFTNLLFPIRLVNCILQGKGQSAEAEVAKFFYNSTAGVLGFGNPSKKYAALNPDPEDLGQTLGTYGIGDGFYIVWPILGPSTFRDTVGLAGSSVINPITYVDPAEAAYALRGYDYFNRLSFRIEDLEALMDAAFDPYEATRDLYIQSRQSRIKR